jgi:hypothetical protein
MHMMGNIDVFPLSLMEAAHLSVAALNMDLRQDAAPVTTQ